MGDPHHVTARHFQLHNIQQTESQQVPHHIPLNITSKGFISFGFDFCPTAEAETNTSLAVACIVDTALHHQTNTSVHPPNERTIDA